MFAESDNGLSVLPLQLAFLVKSIGISRLDKGRQVIHRSRHLGITLNLSKEHVEGCLRIGFRSVGILKCLRCNSNDRPNLGPVAPS